MKTSTFYILLFFFVCGVFACQQSSENNSDNETNEDKTTQPISYEGCYLYINNQDSISLQIRQSNRSITGWLNYDFHQKDGSIGEVKGIAVGDTLKLQFTFLAEGTISEREIHYLYAGESLREGTGEHTVEGAKSTYKNPNNLNFNSSPKLAKVACEEGFINEEYKEFYNNEIEE